MPVNTITLELDRNMSKPENFIPNQQITLDGSTGALFAPAYGCFFSESVRIYKMPNREPLRPGLDFTCLHFNIEGTTNTGREVTTIIRIDRDDWQGQYEFECHYIGGVYSTNPQIIQQLLDDYAAQITTVKWGDVIGKPFTFPGADHVIDIRTDVTGLDNIVEELHGIRDAIMDGGIPTIERMYDYVDQLVDTIPGLITQAIYEHDTAPSVHSKGQIGLGSVADYPPATVEDVRDLKAGRYLTSDLVLDIVSRGFNSPVLNVDPADVMDLGVFIVSTRINDIHPLAMHYLILNGGFSGGGITNDAERYQVAIGINPATSNHPGNLGKMAIRHRPAGTSGSIAFGDWVLFQMGDGGNGGGDLPYIGVDNYMTREELPNGDIQLGVKVGTSANTLMAGNDSRIADAVTTKDVDQSIGGTKIFTVLPRVPTTNPTADSQVASVSYVKSLNNSNVKTSGNQTISGVKTFSSAPRTTQDAEHDNDLVRKSMLDAYNVSNVKLSGAQEIHGKKTFVTVPSANQDPSGSTDLTRKSYVDGAIAGVNSTITSLDSAVVKLTGNQTIGGRKTFSTVPRSNQDPSSGTDLVRLSYLNSKLDDIQTGDVDLSGVVKTTGNQSINGVKTFNTLPVTSLNPTSGNHLTNKNYVDNRVNQGLDDVVKLTGNQSIGGTKTFSSVPKITGTPSGGTDAVNVNYVGGMLADNTTNIMDNVNSMLDGNLSSLATDLGDSNLNDIVDEGFYFQSDGEEATVGRNYPKGGVTLQLEVNVVNYTLGDDDWDTVHQSAKLSDGELWHRSGKMVYNEVTDEYNTTWSGWDRLDDAVKLTGDQTVAGLKTFSTVPRTTQHPYDSNDLTRKSYVDGLVSNVVRTSGNQTVSNIKTFNGSLRFTKDAVDNHEVINRDYLTRVLGALGLLEPAHWTSRNSGGSYNLFGVTYGNGLYVAVGRPGTILSSEDGITWTSRNSGTTNLLRGITYGNGLYVAVGEGGMILMSTDGITWTSRTSGVSYELTGITYANGLYVAVGLSGSILVSTNGITWTERNSGTDYHLQNVTYGNGLYVAVGNAGTILTSTNGTTWTSRTSGVSGNLLGVTYANGLYVAVGGGGTILTSTNGTTWVRRTSATSPDLNAIIHANDLFVAVGDGGMILTSEDCDIWVARNSGVSSNLRDITYGNGLYVVVGWNGRILTPTPSLPL